MILSTTSSNEFEALSDLGIVKNPSPEPAIVRVGSSHGDETNPPCEYVVPPESSFVLCTLPLFQTEVDRPSTSNNYPIPGLPKHQKFNLILMDPPWPNKSVRRSKHYQTHHYSEMDVLTEGLRDILRVHSHNEIQHGLRQSEPHTERQIQSEQSIAAIWITNAEKARRAAYEALSGAGFCICEEWIWVKTTWDGQPISPLDGLWRKPYEILVIGRKSSHNVNVNAKASNTPPPLSQMDDLTRISEAITTRRVIAAVPDLHSRKPNLKSIFDNVFFTEAGQLQEYSALEVFARNLTAGWWAAGDEVLRFNGHDCWVDFGK
jgi:N6-adenosine-specific RNA methylase IME4